MDIIKAAKTLIPHASFTLRGEALELADGSAYNGPLPSAGELQAVMAANAYSDLRATEYPPLTDLADALVHQANGDSSHLAAYVAACNAVKAKYPKP